MRLVEFIEKNIEPILSEWDAFAKTRIPPAATMSVLALRDHAREMLLAVAKDMRQSQSEAQRDTKSKGLAEPADSDAAWATMHGAARHLSGFSLVDVASEFRALRAAVLRLWALQAEAATDLDDLTRFNESIDQALAESVVGYSAKIDESRDTFLAVLGHDLRGPLAALGNCLQLLGGPAPTPAARERLMRIAGRGIASMSAMITDLLEYTRTRLGRGIDIVPESGELDVVCREAVEEARAAHRGREFACDSSGNLSGRFDGPRIRQVMSNLLSNAVQHGDPATPISVDVRDAGDTLTVVVHNRGTPIPPDALQVIFNPLVQVVRAESEPQERPSTSLGLGLFIAREIVTAHGGEIAVTSTAEGGTAFTVKLPRTARRL